MRSAFPWLVAAATVFVAVGGLVALRTGLSDEPDYDYDHPAFERYAARFSALAAVFRNRGPNGYDTIDLAALNDGEWTTACVFGGYTTPSVAMANLGALVSDADERRLREAGSGGFRFDEVEEFEMMLVYVDPHNRAHFIHFPNGIGPNGQHLRKCIVKPETVVLLDGMAG